MVVDIRKERNILTAFVLWKVVQGHAGILLVFLLASG